MSEPVRRIPAQIPAIRPARPSPEKRPDKNAPAPRRPRRKEDAPPPGGPLDVVA